MIRRRRALVWLAAALLVGAAAGFGIGFYAYALYALLLVALVAYLMTYLSLDGITTERHCTLRRGEIGAEAVVTVGIRNTQPFPLPWVVVEDIVGDRLSVEEGVTARALTMRPMGSATLRYRVRCNRRGYHRVGPVLMQSGDFFGLRRRFISSADPWFITIYPRVLPIDRYSVPTHRPMGETTTQMRLFEDPTRIAGVREYRHGDPLRRVHWKASARTGQLHSKIYEPSSLEGGNIVLDFNVHSWEGPRQEARSEFAITVACSVASHLAERGLNLGFVSNGVDAADVVEIAPISIETANREEARRLLERRKHPERLRPVQVKVRRGGESIIMVMESLARLEMGHGLTLAEMVAREYIAWPREDTVILIVPRLPIELLREIARLKSTNFSVLVLLIDNPEQAPGGQSALAAMGLPMLHLRQEADLHRIVI